MKQGKAGKAGGRSFCFLIDNIFSGQVTKGPSLCQMTENRHLLPNEIHKGGS